MRVEKTVFYEGFQFTRRAGAIDGEVNDREGNRSTYTGLTADEAREWFESWLRGEERWVRPKREEVD